MQYTGFCSYRNFSMQSTRDEICSVGVLYYYCDVGNIWNEVGITWYFKYYFGVTLDSIGSPQNNFRVACRRKFHFCLRLWFLLSVRLLNLPLDFTVFCLLFKSSCSTLPRCKSRLSLEVDSGTLSFNKRCPALFVSIQEFPSISHPQHRLYVL